VIIYAGESWRARADEKKTASEELHDSNPITAGTQRQKTAVISSSVDKFAMAFPSLFAEFIYEFLKLNS
jgi:hypothetical protein